MPTLIKTTVIFLHPFELSGFNETLPPGEYELETQIPGPSDGIRPEVWKSSVLVRLHPRSSHPGLDRRLTIPLVELERAVAKDKLTGLALTDFFLEEMLADPMTRLVMKSDGVSEADLRRLYAGATAPQPENLTEDGRTAGHSGNQEIRERGQFPSAERTGAKAPPTSPRADGSE